MSFSLPVSLRQLNPFPYFYMSMSMQIPNSMKTAFELFKINCYHCVIVWFIFQHWVVVLIAVLLCFSLIRGGTVKGIALD